MEKTLPAIPAKRYFTIGEVSELCGVKPYVLRYWEQEFTQLKPMKRRGNRRYYQHHEVLLIRRIRELLYEQGFTISGARNRLVEAAHGRGDGAAARANVAVAVAAEPEPATLAPPAALIPAAARAEPVRVSAAARVEAPAVDTARVEPARVEARELPAGALSPAQMRQELISIRGLLSN
jgi:DNA-binding transcriptional MerR regulator